MVISKLMGGLGNQLFQYALARNLALLNNTKLVFDISAFDHLPDRYYVLDNFRFDAALASPDILKKIEVLTKSDKNILEKISTRKYLHVKQKSFEFESSVIRKYNNHIYLDGYWQSEKFFKEIEDVVRQDLSLQHLSSNINASILETIDTSISVSVHVRRGDYVSNNSSSEFHGLCTMNYYKKSFEYVRGMIDNPRFFIFSDDINWCKANFEMMDNIYYVQNADPLGTYKDLYMMSKCKHHIIANSSFSWWGAWLGKKDKGKIIIAPEHWFNPQSAWFKGHPNSSRDIVPESWIRIKN